MALARAVENIRLADGQEGFGIQVAALVCSSSDRFSNCWLRLLAAAQLRGFETLGNFAEAKIKEAVLAVTGW